MGARVFLGVWGWGRVDLRQGLAVYLSLALNSQFSCLSLLSSGIMGTHHHSQVVLKF